MMRGHFFICFVKIFSRVGPLTDLFSWNYNCENVFAIEFMNESCRHTSRGWALRSADDEIEIVGWPSPIPTFLNPYSGRTQWRNIISIIDGSSFLFKIWLGFEIQVCRTARKHRFSQWILCFSFYEYLLI